MPDIIITSQFILQASVAADGTLAIAYPANETQASMSARSFDTINLLSSGGRTYTGMTASYGSGSITLTNGSGYALPAGTYYVEFANPVEADDASDGRPIARYGTDANNNTVLMGPNGNPTNAIGGAIVAPAIGVAATDAANIVDAIIRAGNGGVVEFPHKQTYIVGGKGATARVKNILPSKIIGNGSIIKLADAQASTVLNIGAALTITNPTPSGGRQVITVVDASKFAVGDLVYFCDASYSAGTNGNYTNATEIYGVDTASNTITVNTVSFAHGSSINQTTGLCIQSDHALAIYMASAASEIEITGLVFDGNFAARKTSTNYRQQWNVGQLLSISADVSIASVWLDSCIFKDHGADAFSGVRVPYFKATRNHFENIWGCGLHPGGTTASTDCIYENNTFYNVMQFCGLYAAGTKYYTGEYVVNSAGHMFKSAQYTTGNTPTDPAGDAYWTSVETGFVIPTADQYGHTSGIGAMVTSTGPVRGVCANNLVNVSRGYGFSAVNTTNTDWVISGNVFKSCDSGGIHCMGGGGSFTGNLIKKCGHEAKHTTDNPEGYGIVVMTGAPAQVSVTGNTLIDSGFQCQSSATDIVFSGNYVSGLNMLNTTGNTNAIQKFLVKINTGKRIVISNNVIALPVQSDHSLSAIGIGGNLDSVKITDNVIDGGRWGIELANHVYNALSITGNTFSNQWSATASGINHARGILGNAMSGTYNGLDISGNTFLNNLSDTSGGYKAMDLFAAGATVSSANISGNMVQIATRSSDTGLTIAAGYDGTNIRITDNFIKTAGGAPLTVAAAQHASMHIRGNRFVGGTSTTISGATVAFAADSNVYT